jgi:hypothetical protein
MSGSLSSTLSDHSQNQAPFEQLRADRLVTNTTSRSRQQIVDYLRKLGFDTRADEVLTPAAAAVRHCRDRGHQHVALLVADALREDLGERQEAPAGVHVDAVIFGDLGRFTDATLNAAFRMLMDGAELVALQHWAAPSTRDCAPSWSAPASTVRTWSPPRIEPTATVDSIAAVSELLRAETAE